MHRFKEIFADKINRILILCIALCLVVAIVPLGYSIINVKNVKSDQSISKPTTICPLEKSFIDELDPIRLSFTGATSVKVDNTQYTIPECIWQGFSLGRTNEQSVFPDQEIKIFSIPKKIVNADIVRANLINNHDQLRYQNPDFVNATKDNFYVSVAGFNDPNLANKIMDTVNSQTFFTSTYVVDSCGMNNYIGQNFIKAPDALITNYEVNMLWDNFKLNGNFCKLYSSSTRPIRDKFLVQTTKFNNYKVDDEKSFAIQQILNTSFKILPSFIPTHIVSDATFCQTSYDNSAVYVLGIPDGCKAAINIEDFLRK